MKIFVVCLMLFSGIVEASVAKLKVDPMQPKIALEDAGVADKRSASDRWKLQAINIGISSRNAIINGKVVVVGQKIGRDTEIRAIEADKVTLSYQGSVKVLRLKRTIIKQESKQSDEN